MWEWKYEFTVHRRSHHMKISLFKKMHYFPFKIIQLSQTWFSIEKHYIYIVQMGSVSVMFWPADFTNWIPAKKQTGQQ
jgi:hypothetical protein